MSKPRIILAEDHVLVAEGIAKLLNDEFDLISSVSNGRDLLEQVRQHHPEVILVDLSLPILTGLEASRQIHKSFPSIPIIILTMHTDPLFVEDAMAAGASGYLIKDSAPAELIFAIKEVLTGKQYINSQLIKDKNQRSPISHKTETAHASLPDLTQRQREILQLIAEGRSNKDIASILNLAIKTVEFHKTRIMRTLHVHSTAELTKIAISQRIITLYNCTAL
jgi:DNA-binding NarL/FixJ family response regulator